MPLSVPKLPPVVVLLAALVTPDPAGAASGIGGPDPDGPEAVHAGDTRTSAVAAEADRALTALADHVREQSHPEALRLAFRAYFSYAARHPDEVRNPYFFFVDYGLGNDRARGYVFDMESLTLVDGPFTVAHGSGSSDRRNGVPTRFSNRPGSYASSLGLYVAQETYGFRGRAGGKTYTSIGLRLKGVSGSFNDAARRRGIVSHGAPYVTSRDAGRSQGCPAMEQHRARALLPRLARGGMVFLFSPRDERWLREDPWLGTGV